MKMPFFPVVVSLAVGLVSQAGLADDTSPDTMRVFYFGNSLTGSSQPEMHADLVKPLGKTWKCIDFLGAGWQTWQHRNELFRALGKPLSAEQSMESKGDLTLDTKPGEKPNFKVRQYLDNEWDAIVIQIFGSALDRKTKEQWGQKFDQAINVGDVVAASDIIRNFLEKNPKGQVFIYTVWPPMDPGKVPPDDQLPEWAVKMKQRSGRLRTAEFPDRDAFNYAERWQAPYLGDMDEPWKAAPFPHWRTRDYSDKVFAGIKANFPELYAEGRLHHLPGGEVFFELDKKMQAGAFPGISTIKDFYTDVQHVRAGAADYTVAALFYAGLFNEKPDGLDYKIYNDQTRYGEDPNNDVGAVLEITPERAKVINDTVWEVLQNHPQANFKKEGQGS